jgi:phytoene desaturase (3,4-didehydrolycopene-forming)
MAYLSWLADARKALVLGTHNFIARDFSNAAEFLDPSRLLPLLGQLDLGELLGPHWSRLQRRFNSPRIAAMLSFQDLYVGLSPYSAPGEDRLNLRCCVCVAVTDSHVLLL